MSDANVGSRFERLPAHPAERTVEGRPTRDAVIAYFNDRFGIDPSTFAGHSFWEKGKGKIWAFRSDHRSPLEVEALGIHLLRTRQRLWKPTTDGIQLFGVTATRNVIELSDDRARRFWQGEAQSMCRDCEPGYVIVTHRLVDEPVPLGVGLYVDAELRSMIPKARRRDIPP